MRVEIEQVFERSPEVTRRLLKVVRPSDEPQAIVGKAREIIGGLREADLIATLNAHPRIGANPTSLSPLSRREQSGDADVATLQALAAMNEEYERTFGFRFVVFVAGRSKAEIVPVMRERLRRTRAEELATGIDEFLAIARDRLERIAP